MFRQILIGGFACERKWSDGARSDIDYFYYASPIGKPQIYPVYRGATVVDYADSSSGARSKALALARDLTNLFKNFVLVDRVKQGR